MLISNAVCAGAACVALGLTAAPVSAGSLGGNELLLFVAGKTITISSAYGSMPVRYNAGGTMTASSKAMIALTGSSRDSGTWRIAGKQFCQRWNVWYGGKEQCFSISKTGSTVHWRSSEGHTGTAVAAN